MAWYEIKYACGHEGREQIYGPMKNRQWIADRKAEGLCPDCYKAELERRREEENRKAAEAAREQGLPELTGTAKQIAWAETIRQKMLGQLTKLLPKIRDEYKEIAVLAVERITAQTSSSWWIDRRMNDAKDLFVAQIKAIEKENEAKQQQPTADAAVEATVRPENPVTETVAEIRALEDAIEVEFPERRDDFRELVKKLKMEWSGKFWRRKLNSRNGTPADRAAEAGHRLLAAGFPVRIFDAAIREKAICGEYEPECTRWVLARTSGDYTGWFAIIWERPDDFYKAAKAIPGSRYSKPSVVVPPEQFEEVLDFAKMYGFRLSAKAQEVIETARRAKEEALIVKPTPPEEKVAVIADGKPQILDVPEEVGVDEELRDND